MIDSSAQLLIGRVCEWVGTRRVLVLWAVTELWSIILVSCLCGRNTDFLFVFAHSVRIITTRRGSGERRYVSCSMI